jgi:hypothetical protein
MISSMQKGTKVHSNAHLCIIKTNPGKAQLGQKRDKSIGEKDN